jgi:anti-sigma regulatory factor (Ser/Thr protein kinase)
MKRVGVSLKRRKGERFLFILTIYYRRAVCRSLDRLAKFFLQKIDLEKQNNALTANPWLAILRVTNQLTKVEAQKMRRTQKPMTEIQMPSKASESYGLRKAVCRLACASLSDPDAAADMELAVGEAFANAVEYGDEDAKVFIKVGASTRRSVSVEMAYSGCKFDTCITNPQDVLSPEASFGSFIMHEIADGAGFHFIDSDASRMTKLQN